MATLSDEDVLKIYDWYLEGMPVRDIAKHFDIVESYVYNLVQGRARNDLHRIYFPSRYRKERNDE